MKTTIDKAARWAKHLDLLNGLDIDNWGVMTLDGKRHINRHPIDASLPHPSPRWEMPDLIEDRVPDISRLPDHLTGVSYMTPEPLPPLISLDPSKIEEPKVHHETLYSYIFEYRGGQAQILAAFTPEINTWWIGRITIR